MLKVLRLKGSRCHATAPMKGGRRNTSGMESKLSMDADLARRREEHRLDESLEISWIYSLEHETEVQRRRRWQRMCRRFILLPLKGIFGKLCATGYECLNLVGHWQIGMKFWMREFRSKCVVLRHWGHVLTPFFRTCWQRREGEDEGGLAEGRNVESDKSTDWFLVNQLSQPIWAVWADGWPRKANNEHSRLCSI